MIETNEQRYMEGYQLLMKIESGLDTVAKRHGITFGQYLILKQIIENGRDEPSLLAQTFGNSRPAMSRKLTALFRSGKIVKLHNLKNEDQRITSLKATMEGKTVVDLLNHEYNNILSPYSDSVDALMTQFIDISNQVLKREVK